MDRRFIAIGCFIITVSWCKMKATTDLFIEESIFHRLADKWIDTNGKFSNVAGSLISIQHLIDPFIIVCRCFDYFTIFKSKLDVVEGKTLVDGGCIIT